MATDLATTDLTPTDLVPAGVAGADRSGAAAPPRPAAPDRRERKLVAACSLGVFLLPALWFWTSDLVPGDALSRVANAYYVLFSRDPHLAAVGFVWNPLPSLALLPFLPAKFALPFLTSEGLIAVLASVALMAATVTLLHRVLGDLGLGRRTRLALTAAFALHPMTLLYAGNGMSEAWFLFFLLLAVAFLTGWLSTPRPQLLAALGVSLGLAYATRYEALAPGLAAPMVVFAVSWWRGRRGESRHALTATVEAVLVAAPFALSFAAWAVASRVIVDQWFATFSSAYGNTAQVSANLSGIQSVIGDTLVERLVYGATQLVGLAPFTPVLLLLAAGLAWLRRDVRVLGPTAILGSVLAFDNAAFVTGSSFGWLRFQIAVVPLAALLAGLALAGRGEVRRPAPRAGSLPTGPGLAPVARIRAMMRLTGRLTSPSNRSTLARVLVVAAVAAGIPAAVLSLTQPTLAREEREWLTVDGAARTAGLARMNRQAAADIDAMRLPTGSVVVDAAYGFPIILASSNPTQFVIDSDRDYAEVLGDPTAAGARYLLISTSGAADAVRKAHPQALTRATAVPGTKTWRDHAGKTLWTLVSVQATR